MRTTRAKFKPRHVPPNDALGEVFTHTIIARLSKSPTPSPQLVDRLRVLTACGPLPSDKSLAEWVLQLRARKAAWEAYLYAAFACGLFEGDDGKDLRRRLIGSNDDGFRSAMAECLACWFFAAKLRRPVEPKPPGRPRRTLDLLVSLPDADMRVEVKAPYREIPEGAIVWGDDSDLLAGCLAQANKQFQAGVRNVLFLVPDVRSSLFRDRYQLIQAFFGKEMITVPINPRTGGPAGPTREEFFPEGMLLKVWKGEARRRFTRVSAVVSVEERVAIRYQVPLRYARLDLAKAKPPWPVWWKAHKQVTSRLPKIDIGHNVLVLHNPFTECPVSEDIWGESPQWVRRGSVMMWTDGAPIVS